MSVVDGLPWWSNLLLLPLLALFAAQVWALVDATATPDHRWRDAGYSKVLCLAVIWFTWPVGMTYYAWRMRPRDRGERASFE
jgi:hypothetical protein